MRLMAFGLAAIWAAAPTLFGADTGRRYAPQIYIGGVVNAASFQPAPGNQLAPGAIVSIFGIDLSLVERAVTSTDLVRGRLPTRFGGVSVLIAGIPSPLFYVSPNQINVQMPAILPMGELKVQIVRESLASPDEKIEVRESSPGLFPFVLQPNFTRIGRGDPAGAVPARPGQVIILLGTGFGKTLPFTFEGDIPTRPAELALPWKVWVGGRELGRPDVFYIGQAPSLAGVNQVNLFLPRDLEGGEHEIFVEVSGARSQPGVFVSVEPQQ